MKLKLFVVAITMTLTLAGMAYADEGREESSQPGPETDKNVTDLVIIAPGPTEQTTDDIVTVEFPEEDAAKGDIRDRDETPHAEFPGDDTTIGTDTPPYVGGGGDTGEATPKGMPDREQPEQGEQPVDGDEPKDVDQSDQDETREISEKDADREQSEQPDDDTTIGDESDNLIIAPGEGEGEDIIPGDETNDIVVPVVTALGCVALVFGAAVWRKKTH